MNGDKIHHTRSFQKLDDQASLFDSIGSSRLFSLRFVLTAPWYLMCTVLMFSYTSTLVSNLTLTELEPIPNSYEELVNSIHSRPLIVFEDMSVTDRILV